jgi:sporulation protein YlmC with PRC-barrel domain
MKVFARQIIGSRLIGSPYKVKGLIIEPVSGKLLSVALRSNFSLLASFSDIEWVNMNKTFRLIDAQAIFNSYDLARSNKVISESKLLRKQKVVTEEGRFIGILKDIQVDTTLGVLTQIQTSRRFFLFGQNTLITRKQIQEITKDYIKVDDDLAKIRVIQKQAEPVVAPPV